MGVAGLPAGLGEEGGVLRVGHRVAVRVQRGHLQYVLVRSLQHTNIKDTAINIEDAAINIKGAASNIKEAATNSKALPHPLLT